MSLEAIVDKMDANGGYSPLACWSQLSLKMRPPLKNLSYNSELNKFCVLTT